MIFESIKTTANTFLATIAKENDIPGVEKIVVEDDTEESILSIADKQKADLIIMGSHRHHGLKKIFIPDMAVHVLKHAKIPLLTIPTGD